MSVRARVVVTRKLPDVVETRMMELFDARLNIDDSRWTQAELAEASHMPTCWCPPSPTASTPGDRRPGRTLN
jgi:hypothetical protein